MLIDEEVGLTDLHFRGGGWKERMDVGFFVIVFFSSFDDGREGWRDRKMHKARTGPLGGGMVDFYDVDDNDLDTEDSSRE